jgi:hypothetical protein
MFDSTERGGGANPVTQAVCPLDRDVSARSVLLLGVLIP